MNGGSESLAVKAASLAPKLGLWSGWLAAALSTGVAIGKWDNEDRITSLDTRLSIVDQRQAALADRMGEIATEMRQVRIQFCLLNANEDGVTTPDERTRCSSL